MNKKLFVFDMDGTLLNSNRTINQNNVLMLNKVMDLGHDVVIATGRNFCQLENELKLFPKLKYIITINGGIIHNIQKDSYEIIAQPLDKDIINEIVQTAKTLRRELQWSNQYHFYRVYFGDDPIKEIEDPNFFLGGTKNPHYDKWDDVKHTINEPILHMAIKCEKKYVLENLQRLKTLFAQTKKVCTITETSKAYLDCDSIDINKYNALRMVQTKLGHDNHSTYAFGDSNNDYLMIKNVHNGIAMGNASEEIKAIADKIIGDNDSNAIADFIEELLFSV